MKRAIEGQVKKEAKDRRRKGGQEGGRTGGRGRPKEQGSEEFAEPYESTPAPQSREKVAAAVGFSHPALRKVEPICRRQNRSGIAARVIPGRG